MLIVCCQGVRGDRRKSSRSPTVWPPAAAPRGAWPGPAHPLEAAVLDAEFLEMRHGVEQILRAGPERPRRGGDALDRPVMLQILRIGVVVAIGDECNCLGRPLWGGERPTSSGKPTLLISRSSAGAGFDQRDGLVARTVFPTIPPRVDYELTKLGHSLLEPVCRLGLWARQNPRRYPGSKTPVRCCQSWGLKPNGFDGATCKCQ